MVGVVASPLSPTDGASTEVVLVRMMGVMTVRVDTGRIDVGEIQAMLDLRAAAYMFALALVGGKDG